MKYLVLSLYLIFIIKVSSSLLKLLNIIMCTIASKNLWATILLFILIILNILALIYLTRNVLDVLKDILTTE